MNELDLEKAGRLFCLLTRRDAAGDAAYQALAADSGSFAEFRVRLLLDRSLVPEAANVVGRWAEGLKRGSTGLQFNEALHTIEVLSLRHGQLERTVGELGAKLLEHVRQIDSVTSELANAQKESYEIGRLLARYRKIVLALSEQTQSPTEAAGA